MYQESCVKRGSICYPTPSIGWLVFSFYVLTGQTVAEFDVNHMKKISSHTVKQSDVGWSELDGLIEQSTNYQAHNTKTHLQAVTHVSSIKVCVPIQTRVHVMQSVGASTTHTKNPFMPQVSAAEKHKHVNSSSLGSLAQHRSWCTKTTRMLSSSREHTEVHLVGQ